ncbi:imidazoleglycerol-phosphate dehydratase HisB [Vitreimonas flagellata]|uniref:imidazoleglycerol-phosphate dehydratase HisB n=1 Tax=Vitreimonas flagellata TaxID=2560861 RepID=UPI0010752720|nr:imidazoleglycerol-phosphate dehydratase HisB [Vitreimonas flagellata]
MMRAPFPPLVANGDGLDAPPQSPKALQQRMAEMYGVDEGAVLPVRGALHGIELVFRSVALDGFVKVSAPRTQALQTLARISGLDLVNDDAGAGAAIVTPLSEAEARTKAEQIAPALLVIDESAIEFADRASLAAFAAQQDNVIVLRSLAQAYGLAGAPCGAAIAAPATIAKLRDVLEPDALPTPIIKLALAALDPARVNANALRVEQVKVERARVAKALNARAEEGPAVSLQVENPEEARAALRKFAIDAEWLDANTLRLPISFKPETNDRALAAFGVEVKSSARRSEVVRETLETRIVAQIDLDSETTPQINTGVGFYDHMLSQIATHGGFTLALTCAGDLDVDTHHSIEDAALALGQALKEALGARRGIARFGFVLPMDEAEAKVSVDLGGRPYLMFDGKFDAPLLGEYPTEMTEHVFRSLAQSMGAAIHVSVTGENDHHKTEACFKAFGRALRQAVRIEGDRVPSTKGSI